MVENAKSADRQQINKVCCLFWDNQELITGGKPSTAEVSKRQQFFLCTVFYLKIDSKEHFGAKMSRDYETRRALRRT